MAKHTRHNPTAREMTLVEILEGTPGGKTYYYHDSKYNQKRAICGRTTKKDGEPCTKGAGWRTNHVGTGACIMHGGRAGRKPTKARYKDAYMSRYRLQEKMDVLLKDADALLDLTKELAAAKAIAQELIESFPEKEHDDYTIHLARFTNVLKTLASVTDKISLIQSRQALTAAQVMYVRAAIVDVFIKHIKDPTEREQAVRDLVFRLGGSAENFQTGQQAYRELKDSGISVNILGA